MKKIIGVIGVVVIAATVFFSNSNNINNNTDLATLLSTATANAEINYNGCAYTGSMSDRCISSVNTIVYRCVPAWTTSCY